MKVLALVVAVAASPVQAMDYPQCISLLNGVLQNMVALNDNLASQPQILMPAARSTDDADPALIASKESAAARATIGAAYDAYAQTLAALCESLR